MKEHGLKFHCKECNASYTVKNSFIRHAKKVHTNKKMEPVIVLDENKALNKQEENDHLS